MATEKIYLPRITAAIETADVKEKTEEIIKLLRNRLNSGTIKTWSQLCSALIEMSNKVLSQRFAWEHKHGINIANTPAD